MKPKNKTPYEIRLELLQLAKDILIAQHNATAATKAENTKGDMFVTTSPSSEDVVTEAEKLNAFVSKANVNT